MRIEIRGRNVELTEELRRQVEKRFTRLGRQVSDLATLEVELLEERNPSIRDKHVAEARLSVKGTTLTARERAPEILHAVKALSEDMRRQVKRHRELRRNRSTSRRFKQRLRGSAA